MSYSAKLEEIIANLRKRFESYEIGFETMEFGGLIHLFFIKSHDEETLLNDWEDITSWVAGNFQIHLNTDYETWNIYLFFLFDRSIDPKLKYRIENDTFSSRKIIIETPSETESLKRDHILNNDLKIEVNNVLGTSDSLQYNPLIWDVLEGKMLKKKKRTIEASNSFDLLIEKIKKKENEI